MVMDFDRSSRFWRSCRLLGVNQGYCSLPSRSILLIQLGKSDFEISSTFRQEYMFRTSLTHDLNLDFLEIA
jgi:hypothetical protein